MSEMTTRITLLNQKVTFMVCKKFTMLINHRVRKITYVVGGNAQKLSHIKVKQSVNKEDDLSCWWRCPDIKQQQSQAECE